MGDVPEELKYTEEHEWVRVEGDEVSIGITDFTDSTLAKDSIALTSMSVSGSSTQTTSVKAFSRRFARANKRGPIWLRVDMQNQSRS